MKTQCRWCLESFTKMSQHYAQSKRCGIAAGHLDTPVVATEASAEVDIEEDTEEDIDALCQW